MHMRQPIHTFCGGAHLFKSDVCRRMGDLAQRALAQHAPDPATLAQACGIPSHLAEHIYARVWEKLRREPVENYLIDFEDGFGFRPDDEEDAAARSAAGELAQARDQLILPAFIGVRIKPLNDEFKARGIRTLQILLDAFAAPPAIFSLVLPKV